MLRGGGQKADVALRGQELHAAPDGLGLLADIANAAHAAVLAVGARRLDDEIERGRDLRIVELAGLAHVDGEIVGADVQHVDALDLGDRLDVLHALDRLDHADDEGRRIQLRHGLGQRHRAQIELREIGADRTAPDRRELAQLDGAARFGGRIDVGKDDAGDAVVEQHRDIGIVDAAHAHQRRHADGQGDIGDLRDRLDIEDRVLHVDEEEVVAGRLGDPRDLARARQPHAHAERGIAGLQTGFNGIDELGHGSLRK